ncbi:MAG: hypothetical protein PHW32_01770 [Bacilli bacterium]|nr:hypothetical protein [Bacilli bacterium]MDD4282320.1 hypothetical protein [Bacilli bacterium]MDD4718324.1 hypothetical protein [Bacilli bacterium]
MNYIYDVLLNYNKNLYEFYEWNLSDNITHIRKIPLLKIKSSSLLTIKNNKIKIGDELKEQIKNKTEIFSKNKNNYDSYSCLFCDGMEAVAIAFDNDGISIFKSKMLIDEEMEVLEVCDRIVEKEITYNVIKEEILKPFKTRFELEKDSYIKKEIKKINDIEKLKYLYYECFNEIEQDKNIILSRINDELNNSWDEISNILYDFFKLTSIKK